MENTKIFLSYAWANADVADAIDKDFSSVGIQLSRDVRDIAYKGSIKEFMERIGTHDFVLMIISDEYLKSLNCMYEVTELLNTHQFEKRILPVSLANATIYKPAQRKCYYDHWKTEINNAEELVREHINPDYAENLKRCRSVYDYLNDFFQKTTDLNILPFEKLKEQNYKPLLDHIGFDDEKLIEEAFTIQNIEDIEEREIALEDFLKKYPDNKHGLFNRAYIEQEVTKQYKKAKRHYEELLNKFPSYHNAHYNLAILLQNHFLDSDAAKLNYEKAIKINPQYAPAHYNLAILLQNHFLDYNAAKLNYEKAIEINPQMAEAHNNLAILVENHFSNYESAKLNYEKAIEINPQHAKAYTNLAYLFKDHFSDPVLAKELYLKAISINPTQKTKERDDDFGVTD